MRGLALSLPALAGLARLADGLADRVTGPLRGRLFLWVPVCLSVGIGGYFALPREPAGLEWAALAVVVVALSLWARGGRYGLGVGPLALGLAMIGGGAGLAGLRSHLVAAPVLDWRYYGAVEGRIVEIDRSVSDAVRLTLDDVVLERMAPARTPTQVRVSLHGMAGDFITPEPGLRVMLTGHLGPPGGAVEPGGFDFRRIAWFEGLGAVGYTRSPVLALAAPEPGPGLMVTRLRMRISGAVQDRLPGAPGAFAAAVLTGDRSGIDQTTMEDLRRSNLAHLLAISGLHMGLLTGFVFAALRLALALAMPLALRVPARKIAASGALAAGAFYLALSGGNVATERAFIMVAVMLLAVLVDRRAISLRSVAMAAVIVLVLRPEALLGAGFQMSFAATIALVAVFGALRDQPGWRGYGRRRWLRPVLSLVVCSVVAGLATAPVAAVHFNRVAEYGLLANVVTVPLMGSVIIPAAVVAAVLTPLGLQAPALWAMEQGARWILTVAAWVAGLDGAVFPVAQAPPVVLPLMAISAVWLVLWPGRMRWAGAAGIALALALWGQGARPVLLIADTGGLVGVMTSAGRAVSKPRGSGFVAEKWLEADGDSATQADAAARWRDVPGALWAGVLPAGVSQEARDAAAEVPRFSLAGQRFAHVTGRATEGHLPVLCAEGRIVITDQRIRAAPAGCAVWDTRALAASGARSAGLRGDRLIWRSAHDVSGLHRWTQGGP
ncbi:competence protein ComEC [Roseicitreum antarcticum]|uniref:Competence protein ComEC n=1 Tax=Roseicitreum antarcticum TaxID=564137 RepID=A0A1H3CBV9_9RHOB|nr:competence protein ComEC [Roseicitreum antarcticum]